MLFILFSWIFCVMFCCAKVCRTNDYGIEDFELVKPTNNEVVGNSFVLKTILRVLNADLLPNNLDVCAFIGGRKLCHSNALDEHWFHVKNPGYSDVSAHLCIHATNTLEISPPFYHMNNDSNCFCHTETIQILKDSNNLPACLQTPDMTYSDKSSMTKRIQTIHVLISSYSDWTVKDASINLLTEKLSLLAVLKSWYAFSLMNSEGSVKLKISFLYASSGGDENNSILSDILSVGASTSENIEYNSIGCLNNIAREMTVMEVNAFLFLCGVAVVRNSNSILDNDLVIFLAGLKDLNDGLSLDLPAQHALNQLSILFNHSVDHRKVTVAPACFAVLDRQAPFNASEFLFENDPFFEYSASLQGWLMPTQTMRPVYSIASKAETIRYFGNELTEDYYKTCIHLSQREKEAYLNGFECMDHISDGFNFVRIGVLEGGITVVPYPSLLYEYNN